MAVVDPTILSTFEVLFTPQFPPGVGPASVQSADENAIKGFFLTLSNPHAQAFQFDVGFHCNVNPAGPPSTLRTLASAAAFLDDGVTGAPLAFSASANGVDFSLRIPVAARGTVLVGVLPQIFAGSTLPPATIEIRGWVDLKLPALLRFNLPNIQFVPQSAIPVQVIATPEQRITFLPIAGGATTAVEAQVAFALPVAQGRSAFAVPPQPGGPIIVQPLVDGEVLSSGDIKTLEMLGSDALSKLLGGVAAGVEGSKRQKETVS